MDRLRSEGRLWFSCSCGVQVKVEDNMPLRMRCHCNRMMIVMGEKDLAYKVEETQNAANL